MEFTTAEELKNYLMELEGRLANAEQAIEGFASAPAEEGTPEEGTPEEGTPEEVEMSEAELSEIDKLLQSK